MSARIGQPAARRAPAAVQATPHAILEGWYRRLLACYPRFLSVTAPGPVGQPGRGLGERQRGALAVVEQSAVPPAF
jgi:hypothetical protein